MRETDRQIGREGGKRGDRKASVWRNQRWKGGRGGCLGGWVRGAL